MATPNQLLRFKTASLPLGSSASPQSVASAPPDRTVRVTVKNVSGAAALLGYPASALTGAVGAGASQVFILLPGDNEVFVLPPGTELFGISLVAGAVVSASTSDALPIDVPLKAGS